MKRIMKNPLWSTLEPRRPIHAIHSICVIAVGFGALIACENVPAQAQERSNVSFAWRPTARRAYAFTGNSDKQFDLPNLIADEKISEGTRNSHSELARFEAEGNWEIARDFGIGARASGGRFRLKLFQEQSVQNGQDYTWDANAHWRTHFGPDFSVTTLVGARVRKWWFQGGHIPAHGNIGLTIGVKPEYGPFSLLVESTLAAVWLTDLTAWGAQKDSSILRIRGEYEYALASFAVWTGAEYYHTHTEWFGSKLVPGQNSLFLDDFDLAGLVGVRIYL